MELFRIASYKAQCRGYYYFLNHKVDFYKKESDYEYSGRVKGSDNSYNVFINVKKPRSNSSCTCPHSNGSRIICKHMVALYFEIFPEMAKLFIDEVNQAQEEYEENRDTLNKKINAYVKKMKKSELQESLLDCLYQVDWLYDKFVKEYIEE